MTSAVLTLLALVATATAVAGAMSLWTDLYGRNRQRINERCDKEFGTTLGSRVEQVQLFQNLNTSAASAIEPGMWLRFQQMLEASRINISAKNLLILSGVGGIAAGLASTVGTGSTFVGLPIGAAAMALPLLYVRSHCQARTRKLCEQLPEAFDVMSRAVRAGQTVSSAMQLIADDLDPPVSEEFAHSHKQQSLGLSQDLALREMARRTGVIELQMFVAALLVQQRSGGNLVELLDNLSGVIRKRLLLQGKLKALTSEGRMQAAVLIVLPLVMFVAMYLLNRSYAEVLLDRPWLLSGTVASALIGSAWIVKLVKIDY